MKIKTICDNCGKEFEREEYEMKRSKLLGRSINCSRYCGAVSSNKKSTRTGDVRNLGKLARKDKFTPFRFLLKGHKQIAKNKSTPVDFNLTAQEVYDQWEKQKGCCAYTGYPMVHPYENQGKPLTPYVASIDRIDSSKGYTKDNIELVCVVMNYAKNRFSKQDILTFFKMQP